MMAHLLLKSILLVIVLVSTVRGNTIDDDWPNPSNRFREDAFLRDSDHLMEHAGDLGVDPNMLSGEEREFYFFKLHDFNNDNRLDGLEILASLRHSVKDSYARAVSRGGSEQEQTARAEKISQRLTHTVDIILRDDDLDRDGYLTYTEFQYARKANLILKGGKN